MAAHRVIFLTHRQLGKELLPYGVWVARDGWLSRRHGLTCDHILAAEVVLADGSSSRRHRTCAEAGRAPDTLRRMLVTGSTTGEVLASAAAFEDAAGLFGEAGFTDLVVNWPRDSPPVQGAAGGAGTGSRDAQPL
ncbi:hypothetical protein AB0I10_27430 [Streptomyces sp. NPDC050636]|uniref:hypothetical protein n=1 Tax=Streptomyces sp. NPDC050636 TaxID=3154510 RepID=UPI0034331928